MTIFVSFLHFICGVLLITLSQSKKSEELPKFYFTSKLQICPQDSPELFYEDVAFTSLSTVVQEGRVFFGVLLDNLEEALGESDEHEKLQEKWQEFTKMMSENLDLKSGRIEMLWDKVITTYETQSLPWEVSIRRAVLYEIFCGLHYEYLILEALVKSGMKEVISSLQGSFGIVIQKLGEIMLNQGEEDPAEMMLKVEKVLLEIEPNFVGRLLSRMLKNGRKIKDRVENGLPVENAITFLTEPLQQIGIVVEAFQEKSQEYPNNFWSLMSGIMKNGTSVRTGDELYLSYSKNEERLIINILNLLAPASPKES